jgi:predicted Zn-dependent peptidase
VRHAKLAKLVRRGFAGLRPGGKAERKPPRPRPRCATVTKAKNDLAQLHVLMGLPAFRENLAERYALHTLNTILGGTMSSRLFQRIREERGLAYSVYSALNGFRDTGHLVIYAATHPSSAGDVIRLAIDELRNLRDHGPTDAELEVAREHLKGSLMLALEQTSSRMSNLARQEIYLDRPQSLTETLRRVSRVTAEQVHRIGRELMLDQRLALAAIGRVRRLRLSPEALRL